MARPERFVESQQGLRALLEPRPGLALSPERCSAACAGSGQGAPCAKVCASRAIRFRDSDGQQKPAIELRSCDRCGLCARVCPSGAITDTATEMTTAVAVGLAAASSQAVVFRCSGRAALAGGPDEAVAVPCFGVVGEGLMALAAAWGAKSIRFDTSHCSGCPNASGLLLARAAAARAERLLAQTGREVAFHFEAPNRLNVRPLPRRGASREVVPAPAQAPAQVTGARRAPMDRRMLKLALPILGTPADGLFGQGEIALWSLRASGDCNTCGVCAGVCPTGALELRESPSEASLLFDTGRCVGCGLCTQRCPSRALFFAGTVRAGDLARPPIVLARDDRRPCEGLDQSQRDPQAVCAGCRLKCPLSAELLEEAPAGRRPRPARPGASAAASP